MGSAGRSRTRTRASAGRCSAPRSSRRRGARKRSLIRTQSLPLLEQLDPRARQNLLALATADEAPRLPRTLERTLQQLLAGAEGTKEVDLGRGIRAVREYDRISLEYGPVRFGP